MTVDDLGHQDVGLLGLGELVAQNGADASLEGVVVFALFGTIAPLVAKERREVEVLTDLVNRHALGHATTEEGRREDGVIGFDNGAAQGETLGRDALLAAELAEDLLLGDGATELGVVLTGLAQLAQAVQHAKTLEGVLAVEDAALVHLAQVALDVGAGQRGATEQHGDVAETLLV